MTTLLLQPGGMLNLNNESAKLRAIKMGSVMAECGKVLLNAPAFTVTNIRNVSEFAERVTDQGYSITGGYDA
ncbi:hypothetical protein CLG94_05645 [Candidatus Methylomirabilis limnetica]|uniref:Uncharacterized protein n=1 Tax=Candidatus Methylomirabilis limnetica TaxID=2033718 RepID=A0A2T4TYH3_9BACT|nr:hypothetical protein CLG94_05645 [Candidatus Methylomirabilis limnetica]